MFEDRNLCTGQIERRRSSMFVTLGCVSLCAKQIERRRRSMFVTLGCISLCTGQIERRRRSMFVAPGWHAVPTGGSRDSSPHEPRRGSTQADAGEIEVSP